MDHQETVEVAIGFKSYYPKPLKVLSLDKNEGVISFCTHKVGSFIQPGKEFGLGIQYKKAETVENLPLNKLVIENMEGSTAELTWYAVQYPEIGYVVISSIYSSPNFIIDGMCGQGGFSGNIPNLEKLQ